MSPDSLPIRLRNARGSMDLMQAAARSGIAAERIKEYESGTRQPYRKTLKRLAGAYGVPLSELAGVAGSSGRNRVRPVRRRRPAASETANAQQAASGTIQVPVGAGGDVRIVIEVVIRVASPQVEATQPDETATESASTPAPAEPRTEPSPVAATTTRRIGAQTSPVPTQKRSVAAGTPTLRKPEDGPRDPLAGVRRAYSEFRHQKK